MDYKELNDYEVVYMVRENDDEAREVIFDKYIPIVKKIASNHLKYGKSVGVDFDDLVQEGLIALNKAIDKYNDLEGCLFYTFACVCVERRILTYCRCMGNFKHYSLNSALSEEFLYSLSDERTPEAYYDEICLEKDFIRFKNLFDFDESCIFELRYNGFSYKEISRLLDVPIHSIDGILYKIRKILRNKRKNSF